MPHNNGGLSNAQRIVEQSTPAATEWKQRQLHLSVLILSNFQLIQTLK